VRAAGVTPAELGASDGAKDADGESEASGDGDEVVEGPGPGPARRPGSLQDASAAASDVAAATRTKSRRCI
jgi:hypothetical protein